MLKSVLLDAYHGRGVCNRASMLSAVNSMNGEYTELESEQFFQLYHGGAGSAFSDSNATMTGFNIRISRFFG